MRKSVYQRPAKPMFVAVQERNRSESISPLRVVEPLSIDKASECHITPSDVACRMVGYLGEGGNYSILEPSAGTGALVSALLEIGHSASEICAIERHHKLAAKVRKLGVPVLQECFLEYADNARGRVEFPRIIMNPPFSQVRKHISAALSLLGQNGHDEPAVLVALVPVTYEHEAAEVLEELPDDTFSTCKVRSKIIRIEKNR